MLKLLTIIPADPELPIRTETVDMPGEEVSGPSADSGLRKLQDLVGGLIEAVANFDHFEGRDCTAWCNEEFIGEGLRVNERATAAWLQALGDGPFAYEPVLCGDVVIEQSAMVPAPAAEPAQA